MSAARPPREEEGANGPAEGRDQPSIGALAQLERVREYRRAARVAIESDQDFTHRCLALIDLADAVRSEDANIVRLWGQKAVWEESARFLIGEDVPAPFPSEAYTRAQRMLRSEGNEQCPICRSRLASDADQERWRLMRKADIEELQRREGAVS